MSPQMKQLLLELVESVLRLSEIAAGCLANGSYNFEDAERELSALRSDVERLLVWLRDLQDKDKSLPPERQ